MSVKPEILFLKQEDVIRSGLLDMKMVLEETEKVFRMLGEKRAINPAKLKLGLPDNTDWDSFFMSMPAFIGGDAHVAGFKWAAESKRNATVPGMPLGVDVVVLSDPDTVYPKAIMDGTIITAMRTSAMAGLAARHMARADSETACLVGAGVIGRTMIMAMKEVLPKLERVFLVDLIAKKAEDMAAEFKDSVEVIPGASLESAAKGADVVVTETTTRKPFVKKSFLAPNATVIQMSSYEIEDEILLSADKVAVDIWEQQIRNVGGLLKKLYDEGKVKRERVAELQELVLGAKPGRESDGELTVTCLHGVGAVDVGVANRIYQNALKAGVGQKLVLWDDPMWV
jgi:ornithine cyclodeaminase